jgi:hypothetical protein
MSGAATLTTLPEWKALYGAVRPRPCVLCSLTIRYAARSFAFGWSRLASFSAAGRDVGRVDPFGFSLPLAVSLRRPPVVSVGFRAVIYTHPPATFFADKVTGDSAGVSRCCDCPGNLVIALTAAADCGKSVSPMGLRQNRAHVALPPAYKFGGSWNTTGTGCKPQSWLH